MNNTLFFIILIVVGVFGLWFYIKKVKHLKLGTFIFITGGVKTGKTLLSIKIALSKYKSRLIIYKITKFLFPRKKIEKPLLYSNIPLKCDFVLLTEDLILRNKRFAFKSVVLVDEASLLADSQLIRDMTLNQRTLVFNKLIGHELKGGVIVYNSQQIEDVNYNIKRCVSNLLYILHDTSLPFFHSLDIRELLYSDSLNVINTFNKDLSEDNKKYFISKKFYKKYDRYCYSVLTDNLPVEDSVIHGDKLPNLKIDTIVSFRKEFKELNKNEKVNN